MHFSGTKRYYFLITITVKIFIKKCIDISNLFIKQSNNV